MKTQATQNHRFKLLAVIMVICIIISLCGCDKLINAFKNEIQSSDSDVRATKPEPTAVPSPTIAPRDQSINPVAEFYENYDAQTKQGMTHLQEALIASGSAKEQLVKSKLERMNLAIRAAYVSVGRLTFDSEGVYNGSVVGAANGSGTLSQNADAYIMRFNYQDGTELYGAFTEKSIIYVMGSAESGYTCCAILKTDTGYRITADIKGEGVIAQIDEASASAALVSFTQPVLEYDASVSDAPDLALYDPSYINIDIDSPLIDGHWQLKNGTLDYIKHA